VREQNRRLAHDRVAGVSIRRWLVRRLFGRTVVEGSQALPVQKGTTRMSRLRVNAFGISIDGYGAGPDQDRANPMGVSGLALHGLTNPAGTSSGSSV
jgi:hypothetical protein